MREWKGSNNAAFTGQQRQAIEGISTQLHELTRAGGLLSGNRVPSRGGSSFVVSSSRMPDGDYGDIRVSVSGTKLTVEAASDIIFLQNTATTAQIQAALDSLTHGGIVQLAPGDMTLTAGLILRNDGVRLRGSGGHLGVTNLFYTADANTDIITIKNSFCAVEDLTIVGASTYGNGYGAVGTGRGIVIAPTASVCYFPTIRNVEVANTGSWCIYDSGIFSLTDLGTGISPNKDYGYPATVATGFGITVCLTLDNVAMSFPNSGGCLYIGSGAAAPRISAIITNGYSFNTYTRINSAGGTAEAMGHVHMYNVADAVFDNKCVWQSPTAQSGGPPVTHADDDATMISMLNCSSMQFDAPYFEVLSGTVGHRNHYFVTSINSQAVCFSNPYVRSAVETAGVGYPLHIMHTPVDDVTNSVTWENGRFYQFRETYAAGTAPLPYETGDPSVWDRDDFVFGGFNDGEMGSPVIVRDCLVVNLTTGKTREPSTPAAGTGSTIVGKQAVSFTDASGVVQLARFDDCNPAGPGTPDDLRARWSNNHTIYGGVLGYSRGTGFYTIATTKHGTTALTSAALFGNVEVGMAVSGTGIPANSYVTVWTSSSSITINNAATDSLTSNLTFTINGTAQREGLWLSSHRSGPDFRQIPYIRVATSEWPGKLAGDLWMQLSGTIVSSVYPTAQFKWYDGSAWQAPLNRSTGTAAGDLITYTASDTPARLAIGSAGQVLQVSGGAPVWGPAVTITDGDKGDITVSGSASALTIDNDVVTYAKMQNVSAASKVLGRGSASGSGDPEEITLGTNLTMSGTTLNAAVNNGSVALTGQTASIGATTLFTGSASTAGLYRISLYAKTTTAGSAGDKFFTTISFNDGTAQTIIPWLIDGSMSTQDHQLDTLNYRSQSTVVVKLAASQNITFITTVTKAGSPVYTIDLRAEFLG